MSGGSYFLYPMANLSTLYVKKGGEYAIDVYERFGFATGEFSFPYKANPKDFAARNVPGEDGERVYFPDRTYMDAYDISIQFKYVGALSAYYTAYRNFMEFMTGLDGQGTNLIIYSPWHRIGRKDVYVKGIDEPVFKRVGEECHISVKFTLRVTNPVEDVVLIPNIQEMPQ